MTSKSLFLRISIFIFFLCLMFYISASEDQCKSLALRKSWITMLQPEYATPSLQEGFASGVIVQTNNGLIKIEEIQIGDLVLSKDFESGIQIFCPVIRISKKIVPAYIEIILERESIITALGQKFYLDFLGKWVTAQELQESLELQLQFPSLIMEMHKVNDPIEVYSLTVDDQHNFYIASQHVLVHNMNPELVFKTIDVATNIFMTHAVSAVQYVAPIVGPAIGGWAATHVIKGFMGKKQQGDFYLDFKHEKHNKKDKNNKHYTRKYKHKYHEHKKKSKEKRSRAGYDESKHQSGVPERKQCNHLDVIPEYIGCGNNAESKDQAILNPQGQCNPVDKDFQHMSCGISVASNEQSILDQQEQCNHSAENPKYIECGSAELINQSDLSEQKGCNYSQDSTKSFEYTESDKKGDDNEGSKAGPELFPGTIQTNDNDQKEDKSNEEKEDNAFELSGKTDDNPTQEAGIKDLDAQLFGEPAGQDEEMVQSNAQEIAKEIGQELISVTELRNSIVNREKQILDNDLAKFGFNGIRVDKLNNKTDPMTGTIGVNTEFDGDLKTANKIYEAKVKDFSRSRRLIIEEIKISDGGAKMVSSIFHDESRVQLRTFGKSGHPKVEITDNVKNTYEKITFK